MRKGFAIIELMTAVFIMGILASFFAPKYIYAVKRARQSQCMATRENIKKAEMLYSYDHNFAFAEDINELVKGNYLDRRPYCSEGGTYVWVSTNPPVLACSVHYWPFTQTQNPVSQGPLPPVKAEPVFYSDFDNMSGLYGLVGQWGNTDGKIYNIGSTQHKLFFDLKTSTGSLKDYSVNVTAETSGPYGIYYRSDGERATNGYLFYYTATKIYVYSSTGGSLKTIASANMPKGFSPYGQAHNVEISVQGTNHSVKIDGKEYLNFGDSKYSSGVAGLFTNSKSQYTYFDAAKITAL